MSWRGVIEEHRASLPVSEATPVITLLEGGTPLIPAPAISERVGRDVFLKFEGMIPTGLLVVMVTSVFIYMGWSTWMWVGSLAAILIVYIMQPIMPKQRDPNHKVRLIGSRFSAFDDEPSASAPNHPMAIADRPAGSSGG